MRLLAVLLAFLAALVAGCGGPGQSGTAQSAPAPSPAVMPETESGVAEVLTALPELMPASIDIPAIDAVSSLIPLGVTERGGWEVPPVETPQQASWFSEGPMPGEPGPAVVLGHVDGGGESGVFARLTELDVGDEVIVRARSGLVSVFRVTGTEQVAKSAFPTAEVLGETAGPELRLVTCGGSFDPEEDSYQDSVIVYATMVT